MSAELPKSLGARTLNAVKWGYIGVVGRATLQLVAQIVLARLLGPEVFGSFAFLLLVAGACYLIAELGLSAAAVQVKSLGEDDVRAVFTWLIVSSSVVALLCALFARLISNLLGDTTVAIYMPVMAIGLIFQVSGSVSMALLRRQLDFQTIQIAQLSGIVVGYFAIGITGAFLGAGVWSLVAAWLTQVSLSASLMYAKTRHPVRPTFRLGQEKLRTIGGRVLLTNLANWIVENVDNFLVGRLHGKTSLGLYAASYNLVRYPTNHLVATLQAVLFPASSHAQDNIPTLRRTYLTAVSAVVLVALPAFSAVAVLCVPIIDVLYGRKWAHAADVLLPLSLAMPFHAAMSVAGPVLWGMGSVDRELRVQAFTAVLLFAVLVALSAYGLAIMAWGVLLVYVLRALWMTNVICIALGLGLRDIGRAITGGVTLATAAGGCCLALELALRIAGAGSATRFVVGAVAAPIAAASAFVFTAKYILSAELLALIKLLATRVPLRLRPMLTRLLPD